MGAVLACAKLMGVQNVTKNEAFVLHTEVPILAVSTAVPTSPVWLIVALNIDMSLR